MAFFVVKKPSYYSGSSSSSSSGSSSGSSSDEEEDVKKAPIQSSKKTESSSGVNVGIPVKVKLPVKMKVRKATEADDSESSKYSFSDFFEDLISAAMQRAMAAHTTGICVDWLETPEAHVFTACLGGIKKEQLKVQVKGNGLLTISGEPPRATTENSLRGPSKQQLGELLEPKFSRTFKVACDFSADQVNAKFEDDLLTVTILKKASPKYEAQDVKIIG